MLCYEESFIPISKRFKREDPENKLTQVKIYHESPPAPMQIVLYKQKAFITIHDGKNITVIHFDEPNAYAGFKNHFDKAWDQRIRTFKGEKGVQEAYSKLLNAAKPSDEVIIFAAKPSSLESARYNLKWNEEINKKTKGVRLLYYGNTTRNKERAQELRNVGCQAKTMPTEQELPISTIVMGNKTITTVWSNEPVAFFIEDKTTADAYRENFEQLWNQDTYILKGVDAVGDLFDEMLEHGEADLIGARGYFVDLRPEFTDDWEKRAIKSGFKMRNIVDPTVKGHRVTTFPFVKMKYTLNKEFSKLSVFWIYGNKVAISNWTEKEPIIVVIKNKHIYNLYKQQFELLWNN
ncbi:hypothetical protein HQ571_02645 [Candidatus Kuenenbacteria bacterium]|nr:hypothetical protein [Candidatus Kuenenbacteria bacterium]